MGADSPVVLGVADRAKEVNANDSLRALKLRTMAVNPIAIGDACDPARLEFYEAQTTSPMLGQPGPADGIGVLTKAGTNGRTGSSGASSMV